MLKPVSNKDLLWAYSAAALNIGAGLILLPIILRYLSAEDVGLWFVFITLASLAQLLEMGFQPTLARNVSYVYAGAQTLSKVGFSSEASDSRIINKALLDTLVATARRIYKSVAVIAALLMFLGGTYYVNTLLTPKQNYTTSLFAWVAFASGYIVNIYYGYINGVLQGRGYVSQANKIVVLTRSLQILMGGAAVVLNYGILGLGLSSLLAAAVGRIIALRFFNSFYKPSSKDSSSEVFEKQRALMKILWHNASRLGAVQLGGFLIQRGNILVASSFLGLAEASSYGLSVSILMVLSGIGMVISQVQFPHMSALQFKSDRKTLAVIYGQIQFISWALFILGLILIIIMGNELLAIIGSEVRLLPNWLLLSLGIIILLEMNHSIAGGYLTTLNQVPFLPAALLSGATIILLTLLTISSFGVYSLIATQGFIQLAFNNWKWPLEAYKHLESDFSKLMISGMRSLYGKFL